MVALGEKAIDFVVVQFANEVGLEDCQEVECVTRDAEQGLVVVVEDGSIDRGAISVMVERAKL